MRMDFPHHPIMHDEPSNIKYKPGMNLMCDLIVGVKQRVDFCLFVNSIITYIRSFALYFVDERVLPHLEVGNI